MKKVIFVLMVLGGCVPGISQTGFWEELNPPPGGEVRTTQVTNGWVYAVLGDSTLYRSQDNGRNWVEVLPPVEVQNTSFKWITVGLDGDLFVQQNETVFKSTDGGLTWSIWLTNTGIYDIHQLKDGSVIAIRDSVNGSGNFVLHEIVKKKGIFSSWKVINTISSFDYQLIVSEMNYIAITYNFNLVVSYDGGNTWTTWQKAPNHKVFVTPDNTGIVWYEQTKYIERQHLSDPKTIVVIDSTIPASEALFVYGFYALGNNQLLASTDHGMYKSTNDGESWTLADKDLLLKFSSLNPLSDGTWLYIVNQALFRGESNNQKIAFSEYGINHGFVKHYSFSDSNCYFVETDAAIWKTCDDADNWELVIQTPLQNSYYNGRSGTIVDSTGFIAVTNRDTVFFSTDFGATFSNFVVTKNDDITNIGVGFNHFTNSIFTTNFNGIQRSNDFGATWMQVLDNIYLQKMAVHPSGTLFAKCWMKDNPNYYTLFLFRSTDNGETWEMTFGENVLELICTTQGDVFISSFNGLFRSNDLGLTWNKVSDQNSFEIIESNNVFIDRSNSGISISINQGVDWTILPKIKDNANVLKIGLDKNSKAYASASASVFAPRGRLFRSKNTLLNGATLIGSIQKDADANCTTPDPADPLKNWLVQAQNGPDTWFANTDTAGKYRMFVDTGSYEISIRPPLAHLLWEACDDTLNINLPELLDTTEADFLVKALADCPYLGVDLAVSAVAPCFPSYGSAAWCNYGTETADTAYLDLTLDPLLDLTSSSLPGDSLGGGVWRFQLGSIESGECGNLWFDFIADCDSTVVGQAVCLDAHIHPDSLCVNVPGWSGALLKVTATCLNDISVNFEIKNVGSAPSQPLEYIIVEDDVVLREGLPEIYDILETKNELVSMSEGHFLRLESEQEPGYPLGSVASAFSINCGAPTLSPTVLWYNLDDGPLAVDHECAIAVASFDPNDKTGLPLGYGNAHFIEANTDLEYTIRFQNTGTAAAHFVVIRDTLSEKLDPMSIRPGAASHPFSWKLEGNGFVSFRFDDINLPDSNANEAASHGFVSFKISQKPNLPDGTLIENRASIYFDYNGAVQTNTTTHRIGHDFISFVENPGGETILPKVKIWPNPLAESALLTFDGLPKNESYRFILTDISGKNLQNLPFSGDKVFFRKENLPSGLYFFEIKNGAGAGVFSGKLVLE